MSDEQSCLVRLTLTSPDLRDSDPRLLQHLGELFLLAVKPNEDLPGRGESLVAPFVRAIAVPAGEVRSRQTGSTLDLTFRVPADDVRRAVARTFPEGRIPGVVEAVELLPAGTPVPGATAAAPRQSAAAPRPAGSDVPGRVAGPKPGSVHRP